MPQKAAQECYQNALFCKAPHFPNVVNTSCQNSAQSAFLHRRVCVSQPWRGEHALQNPSAPEDAFSCLAKQRELCVGLCWSTMLSHMYPKKHWISHFSQLFDLLDDAN